MLGKPETPTLTNDERKKSLTTLDKLAGELGQDATLLTLTHEQAWRHHSTLSAFRSKESSQLISLAQNSWRAFEGLSPRAENHIMKNS